MEDRVGGAIAPSPPKRDSPSSLTKLAFGFAMPSANAPLHQLRSLFTPHQIGLWLCHAFGKRPFRPKCDRHPSITRMRSPLSTKYNRPLSFTRLTIAPLFQKAIATFHQLRSPFILHQISDRLSKTQNGAIASLHQL